MTLTPGLRVTLVSPALMVLTPDTLSALIRPFGAEGVAGLVGLGIDRPTPRPEKPHTPLLPESWLA